MKRLVVATIDENNNLLDKNGKVVANLEGKGFEFGDLEEYKETIKVLKLKDLIKLRVMRVI